MINHIKIQGEERPFLFSYRAIKMMEKLKKDEDDNFQNIELVAYCGFYAGHKKEKKEVKFSLEDMEDWLDDDLKVIGEISKIAENAMGDMNAQKGEEPGNPKPLK